MVCDQIFNNLVIDHIEFCSELTVFFPQRITVPSLPFVSLHLLNREKIASDIPDLINAKSNDIPFLPR